MNGQNPEALHKQQLREEFGRLFLQMSPDKRHEADLAIEERLHRYLKEFTRHKGRASVLAYDPMRREVPVLKMLLATGVDIYLPLIKGVRLKPVSFDQGVPSDIHKMDLIITPGLFCSAQGYRLGRGRGYYDRLLASYPHAHSLFVGYDWQIRDDLPVEKWDRRVGSFLTDKRTARCYFLQSDLPESPS